MTIFDLLLIAVVLACFFSLILAASLALSGKRRSALRTLEVLLGGIACYLVVVCVVGLFSKPRLIPLGTSNCSDDWCVTPLAARQEGSRLSIDFRVFSRARRVTQREFGVEPYLRGSAGRRYAALAVQGPAFDQAIAPGESFLTTRVFQVPPYEAPLRLFLRGDGIGPDTFVIAASRSLLHPRDAFRIR